MEFQETFQVVSGKCQQILKIVSNWFKEVFKEFPEGFLVIPWVFHDCFKEALRNFRYRICRPFLRFLDPEIAPFLLFLDPEIHLSIFTISDSRICSISEVSGSKSCSISTISGITIIHLSAAPNPLVGSRRGATFSRAHLMIQKLQKWCSFWIQKQ